MGCCVSCAGLAHAQAAPPAPAGKPAPADQARAGTNADDTELDALVSALLETGPAGDDDLAWLFSDSPEYAEPTSLSGKPVLVPSLPRRGQGSHRVWRPEWRKFSAGDYILTGTALAVAAGSAAIPTTKTRWRGHNSFDESVRRGIGVTDYESGFIARDTSDLLLSVSIAYPLLFDSLVVMYWYRESHEVAGQMALITAEAVSVAAAVQGLTAGFASRERPYGRNCGAGVPSDLEECSGNKRFRSFFSGHTAMSFAAAGATCSLHAQHSIYGDSVADGVACGSALTVAAAVGTLRIVGDQHYATDVLMGAGVGALSGIGVPWLLHYGPLARQRDRAKQSARLSVVPVPYGLGLGGEF